MANAHNEFLRDLISLSYKLDQMIDETTGSEHDLLISIRDRCDDSLAWLLELDDAESTPVAARRSLANYGPQTSLPPV